MDPAWIAISISIVALVISLVSLWETTLAPFKLEAANEPPTFTVYKITPEMHGGDNKTWWIPSFDMGLTFHNTGRTAGKVIDLRLIVEIHDLDEKSKHRVKQRLAFEPMWIVDYPSFQQHRTERFRWVHEAAQRDWYPVILPGQQSVNLHVIFESERWEEAMIGMANVQVQVASSEMPDVWMELGKYEFPILSDLYDGTAACFTAYDSKLAHLRSLP